MEHAKVDLITPLQLSQNQLQVLLEKLDRQNRIPVEQLRRNPRIPCRRVGMVLTVDQQGYETTFIIPVRNISRGGVGFLHRAMLHNGTRCLVRIKCPDGTWIKTWGNVVRSRYVDTAVCEIGVKFDAEIDVTCFGETPSC